MLIDFSSLREQYARVAKGKESKHSGQERFTPSIFRYDYLALSRLRNDIETLIGSLPAQEEPRLAIDLGCGKSPYRNLLERNGYQVQTFDTDVASGADYLGEIENTKLPSSHFDLVLCTQVLEHCSDPFKGAREINRILKPGGFAILSVPHVWFYHPHPSDHWRFTQEGIIKLCRQAGLEPAKLLAQGGSLLSFLQVCNFLLYGVVGTWGAPAYSLLNAFAEVLDHRIRNHLFSHNFACLAQRPLHKAQE
ncbi:MAG: class I SAM-dependent methyltransferase [Acidobacteria bacterium]|nr:class I SAM-dependent methyltransferase [Acidobacteriota bacterium]MCI0719847.1 class I SAM-dependent methyltransferase [Acidobacteriota bacterium]